MYSHLILAYRDMAPHDISMVSTEDRHSTGEVLARTVDVVLDVVCSYQLLMLLHSEYNCCIFHFPKIRTLCKFLT